MNDTGLFYVTAPVAILRQRPDGPRDRELRYGEDFTITDRQNGMAYGMSPGAGHTGWIPEDQLAPAEHRQGQLHYVVARQTHAYPEPDFKAPKICALPHLARLCVTGRKGRYSQTELGWVPTAHLGGHAPDHVAIAERYLGVPYLWGGNSIWGIDCSGLVHAALMACGLDCPSDSGPQERGLGQTLPEGSAAQRGDLLFWKGHVALVSDPETILHANAFHMAVTYEPLVAAIDRIAAQGDGPVIRHARLVHASEANP